MLELYDRKFVLTTLDGKLISAYHDFYEAKKDARDLAQRHKDEKFYVWELKDEGKLEGDTMTRAYTKKEEFEYQVVEAVQERTEACPPPAEAPSEEKKDAVAQTEDKPKE
jgi:hypothetical protein